MRSRRLSSGEFVISKSCLGGECSPVADGLERFEAGSDCSFCFWSIDSSAATRSFRRPTSFLNLGLKFYPRRQCRQRPTAFLRSHRLLLSVGSIRQRKLLRRHCSQSVWPGSIVHLGLVSGWQKNAKEGKQKGGSILRRGPCYCMPMGEWSGTLLRRSLHE